MSNLTWDIQRRGDRGIDGACRGGPLVRSLGQLERRVDRGGTAASGHRGTASGFAVALLALPVLALRLVSLTATLSASRSLTVQRALCTLSARATAGRLHCAPQ